MARGSKRSPFVSGVGYSCVGKLDISREALREPERPTGTEVSGFHRDDPIVAKTANKVSKVSKSTP
ncbi:MAG: hypothetical protein F6J93_13150 [Oscillatoria sp. SIO1A7]|nr:hypothetical protein [Oscillatoria sp. SIO1A7]